MLGIYCINVSLPLGSSMDGIYLLNCFIKLIENIESKLEEEELIDHKSHGYKKKQFK